MSCIFLICAELLQQGPLWLKACTQLTAGLQGGQQEELDRAKCDIQHIALQWEIATLGL